MKTLDREHVRSVVNTIFSQLLHTTSIDVINSWGISKMYATQIVKNVNGENFTMAALVMQVKPSSREQSQPGSSSRRYQPARGSR